ncbi:hypothetical protein ACFOG5_17100 [Pedobacter fastidiosus]|uniref:Uncharacterized protein n=1 Tax=Pedobacter fastidiosus TaxID=2765361 RepID=A0ABR7KRL6_9SPHI|nr:hypothetical protein [Pedobacter fastidiosus]MBC6110695.1 hypothetical protein [Pedobacter fastidiosus]
MENTEEQLNSIEELMQIAVGKLASIEDRHRELAEVRKDTQKLEELIREIGNRAEVRGERTADLIGAKDDSLVLLELGKQIELLLEKLSLLPPEFRVRTEHHFGVLTKTVMVCFLLFAVSMGTSAYLMHRNSALSKSASKYRVMDAVYPGLVSELEAEWKRGSAKILAHADSILVARENMLRAEQQAAEKQVKRNKEREKYNRLQGKKFF